MAALYGVRGWVVRTQFSNTVSFFGKINGTHSEGNAYTSVTASRAGLARVFCFFSWQVRYFGQVFVGLACACNGRAQANRVSLAHTCASKNAIFCRVVAEVLVWRRYYSRFGAVWCRPGERIKQGSGGSGWSGAGQLKGSSKFPGG